MTTLQFSANLGFLWQDQTLPQAIHSAKAAGFDAVECHWPYAFPAQDVQDALQKTGLRMLGLNTHRGNVAAGDNGLAAMPGREAQARAAIDEAIDYAIKINTPNIHVMAGFATGKAARQTFIANLQYACERASPFGITILIEPLNHYDAPGYFLTTSRQAEEIIEAASAHGTTNNLRLMFDCYHIQLMEGDLSHRLRTLMPIIGHIQFASVPDRGPPGNGEICYAYIFDLVRELGYSQPLGAEYKPVGDTAQTLGWMLEH